MSQHVESDVRHVESDVRSVLSDIQHIVRDIQYVVLDIDSGAYFPSVYVVISAWGHHFSC